MRSRPDLAYFALKRKSVRRISIVPQVLEKLELELRYFP